MPRSANIKEVMEVLEMDRKEFLEEWKELSPADKEELKLLAGAELSGKT